jgi:hypothetical protein
MFQIAGNIALKFAGPIAPVGFWFAGDLALWIAVLMPEATVNLDYLSAGTENQVRLSRQALDVKAVAIAKTVY